MTIRIGLLLCDRVAEKFRRIEGDYPEMFTRLFDRFSGQVELAPYDIANDHWPAGPDSSDAFMTTGSRLSVYDDVPWLRTFGEFIRSVRAAGTPFIGICFGHQMMAEALGGRVRKADQGWGVGLHPVEISRREDWMTPFQPSVSIQYMHQDQVVELPPDAVPLAASDHCPFAMYEVGRTMLGIQAHPEFGKEYVRALIEDRVERIGRARAAEALARIDQTADSGLVAGWIVEFLKRRLPVTR